MKRDAGAQLRNLVRWIDRAAEKIQPLTYSPISEAAEYADLHVDLDRVGSAEVRTLQGYNQARFGPLIAICAIMCAGIAVSVAKLPPELGELPWVVCKLPLVFCGIMLFTAIILILRCIAGGELVEQLVGSDVQKVAFFREAYLNERRKLAYLNRTIVALTICCVVFALYVLVRFVAPIA